MSVVEKFMNRIAQENPYIRDVDFDSKGLLVYCVEYPNGDIWKYTVDPAIRRIVKNMLNRNAVGRAVNYIKNNAIRERKIEMKKDKSDPNLSNPHPENADDGGQRSI